MPNHIISEQCQNTHGMQPFCFSCSSPLLVVLFLLLLLRLSTPSLAWAAVSRTITVDRQGRGDFPTVQSAVDSVPDGNRDWIKIHVHAGSYWSVLILLDLVCGISLDYLY